MALTVRAFIVAVRAQSSETFLTVEAIMATVRGAQNSETSLTGEANMLLGHRIRKHPQLLKLIWAL